MRHRPDSQINVYCMYVAASAPMALGTFLASDGVRLLPLALVAYDESL